MAFPNLWKKLIIFLAVTSAAFWAAPAKAETYSNGEARISYMEEEVLLKNAETEDWIEVTKNLPLKAEDNLWVPGGGRAEIKFSEGSFARLAENTALAINKLERTEQGARTELVLSEGTATLVARAPYRGGLEFLVDTPTLTVKAGEEATFRLNVDGQGATTLVVHKGTVEASSSEGTVNLGQGQAARFADGKMIYQEYYAKDSWDRWNDRRDATYASAKSRKYLPPSMASEAADFDNNGRWAYTEDYGNVWVPNEPEGWTPYRDGRWVYVGPDMVWVPFEPWGWAPFHFGRWAFLPVGWAWVPPLPLPLPFWVPAAVTWFTVNDLVCWAPLAPGEVFFGWRVFGPGCFLFSDPFFRVHVTNIFVFEHVHHHRGVVAFDRHHFFDHNPHRVFVSSAALKGAQVKLGDPKDRVRVTKAAFDPRPDKVVPAKALPSKQVMLQTNSAKVNGLRRVSTTQRQTMTSLPAINKGKISSFKGATTPNSSSLGTKPGVNSRMENRTNFSPQNTSKGDFKNGSAINNQGPRSFNNQTGTNSRSSNQTWSTPRNSGANNRSTFQSPPPSSGRFQTGTSYRSDSSTQIRSNEGVGSRSTNSNSFSRSSSSFAPRTQTPAFSSPRTSTNSNSFSKGSSSFVPRTQTPSFSSPRTSTNGNSFSRENSSFVPRTQTPSTSSPGTSNFGGTRVMGLK